MFYNYKYVLHVSGNLEILTSIYPAEPQLNKANVSKKLLLGSPALIGL